MSNLDVISSEHEHHYGNHDKEFLSAKSLCHSNYQDTSNDEHHWQDSAAYTEHILRRLLLNAPILMPSTFQIVKIQTDKHILIQYSFGGTYRRTNPDHIYFANFLSASNTESRVEAGPAAVAA